MGASDYVLLITSAAGCGTLIGVGLYLGRKLSDVAAALRELTPRRQ